jgi:hypothetical protein
VPARCPAPSARGAGSVACTCPTPAGFHIRRCGGVSPTTAILVPSKVFLLVAMGALTAVLEAVI